MTDLLGALRTVLGLALGLLQVYAIDQGIVAMWGWHWGVALLIAVPLAVIPLVGTGLGAWAAMRAWYWPLSKALLVFFGALVVIFVIGTMIKAGRKA